MKERLMALVSTWLDGPPVHPPGSMMAGSVAEDLAIARWVGEVQAEQQALDALKPTGSVLALVTLVGLDVESATIERRYRR